MSTLPDGVTWPEIVQMMKLIEALLVAVHSTHGNPRVLTIALWATVELDMIAATKHISIPEYERLSKFGRESSLKIVREGYL